MDATIGDCWRCKKPAKKIICETCGVAEYCSISCRKTDLNIHKCICCCTSALLFCANCEKKSSGLKRCKGCYSVVYCNTNCQKNHWPKHKEECKMFFKRIEYFINALRRYPCLFMDLPWYLGITLAEDYLNLTKNEGCNYSSPLRLLFAAVGDIKDVVLTVNNIPEKCNHQIEFLLNDFSPHIMARNILFLYCALVEEEINHLIQIWYSVLLTKNCLKYLISVLNTLVESSKETVLNDLKNLVILDSHWEKCREVWEGWLKLADDPKKCNKIVELREKIFTREKIIEEKSLSYFSSIPAIHKESMQAFFKTGLFLPLNSSQRMENMYGNPTMTCFNPLIEKYNIRFPDINKFRFHLCNWGDLISSDEEMIYAVRDDAFVFKCWDYLKIKKMVGLLPDISEMYILYLEKIFSKFSSFMKGANIHVRLIVDDFQELNKHLDSTERFDRIATSNLCDYFPTPLLLEMLASYLNCENKCSVLISREEKWPDLTSFDRNLISGNPIRRVCLAEKDVRERTDILEGINELERHSAVLSSIMCSEDYCESNSFVFWKILLDILIYQFKKDNLPPTKLNLKYPSVMAGELGVNFRDFRLELNHVIPFRREGNIRRISVMRNNCRYLEWSVCS